jgi:hypothetical protein
MESFRPSFSCSFSSLAIETDWRLDCTGHFRKQEMRYWWPMISSYAVTILLLVPAHVEAASTAE